MKELPYIEEIYDFETDQLERIYEEVEAALMSGGSCELPAGFDSYEKFERKAMKLKEALELELDERRQVDDVLNFFVNKQGTMDLLNDDAFYKLPDHQQDRKPQQKQQFQPQKPQQQTSYPESQRSMNTAIDSESVCSQIDDTQSEQDQSAASDLSKQMFAKRSSMIKNKKDLQQFMKEKLQKTKVASESVASSSTVGPSAKNFTKKKTEDGGGKKLKSDTQSVISDAKSTQSNIYKPNLRKGTASSTNKPVKQQRSESKDKRSSISRQVSNEESAPKKIKDNFVSKPSTSSQTEKPKVGTKKASSKPPIPVIGQKKAQDKKPEENKISKQEDQQEQVVGKWIEEEVKREDDNIMGQEEITSKYSDNETATERELDFNEDKEDSQSQQLDIEESKTLDMVDQDLIKIQNAQIQQSEALVNKQKMQEIERQGSMRSSQHQSAGEEEDITQEQIEDYDVSEQEELKEIVDKQGIVKNTKVYEAKEQYERNETPKEPFELIKDNKEEGLESKTQPEDVKKQFHQFQIQPDPNKKIRGKVQVFVDEEAISNRVSPRLQSYREQSNQSSPAITHVEKQEPVQNNSPIKVNKTQELMRRIQEQDSKKRQEEQEQRLKQVKEELEKQKQVKQTETIQITQQDEQTSIQQQSSQQQEQSKQSEKPTKTNKPSKPSKPTQKKQSTKETTPSSIPRVQLDEQVVDYSPYYKSFYDIFVGQVLDPKGFDISFVMREMRNMYATFVNIMDNSALKKKHQFDQTPLEKAASDYLNLVPNHFMLTGKSINDLELEMKNRNNDIMHQAMAQLQLRDRFQQLKQKELTEIVKEATQKTSNNLNSLIDMNRESSLYFRVVKNRSEVYDIITRAFSRKRRWNELPHGLDLRNSWNLLWTWSKIKIDLTKLISWQRCNHFNGAKNVSRKDFLQRNIQRAQGMSAKAKQVFNIIPMSFVLPKEYVSFLENFSEFEDKEGKFNLWIMKPAAKSRGRGITLVNDISNITYGEPVVIQRYIKNPLLINGYKFDMRIYVLVTSVNPLEAFLYREGFGRFSTMPFTIDPTDKNNKYIHLTNVSIQKYNVNNQAAETADSVYGGTKISIQTLKKRVQEANNINWDEQIWPQVKEVILKSLVACQNDIQYNPCCFELFGYDIMIDDEFKCWLIEINSSPSLARETLLDDMIKQRLIDDTIDLVDPLDFDRKRLFEVLERRINDDFKQNTSSNAFAKKTMNRDLTYILNGQVPRKYGEMPKQLGNYERIAPSQQSDYYLKLIGGQKMFGSLMKNPQLQ